MLVDWLTTFPMCGVGCLLGQTPAKRSVYGDMKSTSMHAKASAMHGVQMHARLWAEVRCFCRQLRRRFCLDSRVLPPGGVAGVPACAEVFCSSKHLYVLMRIVKRGWCKGHLEGACMPGQRLTRELKCSG